MRRWRIEGLDLGKRFVRVIVEAVDWAHAERKAAMRGIRWTVIALVET